MDERKILKRSSQVVTREMEGEMIVLPLYRSSKDLNCIYTLNETATAVWELINDKRTIAQIKEEMLKTYDVSEEKVTKQLDGLIKDLKSIKAIL